MRNIPAWDVLNTIELNGPWPMEFVAVILQVYLLNSCRPVNV